MKDLARLLSTLGFKHLEKRQMESLKTLKIKEKQEKKTEFFLFLIVLFFFFFESLLTWSKESRFIFLFVFIEVLIDFVDLLICFW